MEIEIVGDLNFNIIMSPTAFLYRFHNSKRSVQLGKPTNEIAFRSHSKNLC